MSLTTNPPKLNIVSGGNAKLAGFIHTISLPSGYSCPGAQACRAHFDIKDKKLIDGPDQKYRCFAANSEAAFPSVRNGRHANMNLLLSAQATGGVKAIAELIAESLPKALYMLRIHQGGDFFSYQYWAAWMEVMQDRPDAKFYAYTKSHKFVHRWLVEEGQMLPDNFQLNLSDGSKCDELIPIIRAHCARVNIAYTVFHPSEATAMNMLIDHDDMMAAQQSGIEFCLLLHGSGPPKSEHQAATARMRAEGVKYAYTK